MNRFQGPPAHVPTLTDIVAPDPPTSAFSRATGDHSAVPPRATATDLQALMVERVVRHVSGVLEKRLLQVTEELIRSHVQVLLPPLVNEIERVVRESVTQALERELPASPRQPDRQTPTRS